MNKKVSLILIILGIVFTIVGVTISYYIWSSSSEDNTLITFTVSNNFSCSADGGGNITSGDVNLVPTEVNDSTVGNYIKREVKVYPQTVTGAAIYMDLWLTVNSIDSGLSNSTNFMYAFTTGSTGPTDGIVVSGNFNGTSAGDKINLLYSKEYALTLTDTYYLWIWLSADESSVDTMNQSFSLLLGGVCLDQEPITATSLVSKANPSTLTYTDATDSQKKEMWTFSHDATEQVPATTDYRYIGGGIYCSYESGQYGYSMNLDGTCPKRYNYVRTTISSGGTTTYTNQSSCPSDTSSYTYECTELTSDGIVGVEPNNYITYNDEVWRIIGVFDGRIKIIRDQSIGSLSWDFKQNGVGSSTSSNGSNDWTDSQLMYMLNPTSYKLKEGYTVTDNMIYDANGNIIYQLGCTPASIATGATTYSCTANTYSLNETALSQIDEATYYLGGSSSSGHSADSYYTFERGTTVYSGRPTSWTGLVGLMYPSDYAYTFANGVDDTCYTDTSHCYTSVGGIPSSSWLYNGAYQWTVSPFSSYQYFVFIVYSTGLVSDNYAGYSTGVRLVVYLKSDIQLVGTGESGDPYQIIN